MPWLCQCVLRCTLSLIEDTITDSFTFDRTLLKLLMLLRRLDTTRVSRTILLACGVELHKEQLHELHSHTLPLLPSSRMSSLNIFTKFVSRDEHGKVDISGILSRNCYDKWLKTRETPPRDPEEAFRKVITGHCRLNTPYVA